MFWQKVYNPNNCLATGFYFPFQLGQLRSDESCLLAH